MRQSCTNHEPVLTQCIMHACGQHAAVQVPQSTAAASSIYYTRDHELSSRQQLGLRPYLTAPSTYRAR